MYTFTLDARATTCVISRQCTGQPKCYPRAMRFRFSSSYDSSLYEVRQSNHRDGNQVTRMPKKSVELPLCEALTSGFVFML